MKPLPILVFAAALATGAAIGWSGHRAPNVEVGATAGPEAGVRTPAGPKWGKEDFLKSIRSQAEQAARTAENPYAKVFDKWRDDEVRSALEESLVHPECVLEGGSAVGMDMVLLGEWMSRDLDAVMAWCGNLESLKSKQKLALGMSYKWPAERASEGLAFVLSNREVFLKASPWSILVKNVEAEARKGPAALESLLRLLREKNLELDFGNPVSLPPDFNHRALLDGEEYGKIADTSLGQSIFLNWYSSDRDGAFDWMLETQGGEGFRWILDNPIGMNPDALRWLGGRVENLESGERSRFIDLVRESWILNPHAVQLLMEGTSDGPVREDLYRMGIQSLFAGRTHAAMPLIETIPDLERRIALLESAEPDAMFLREPNRRSFSTENEVFLRCKLAEWNASEDRIEAILSKYRK